MHSLSSGAVLRTHTFLCYVCTQNEVPTHFGDIARQQTENIANTSRIKHAFYAPAHANYSLIEPDWTMYL